MYVPGTILPAGIVGNELLMFGVCVCNTVDITVVVTDMAESLCDAVEL